MNQFTSKQKRQFRKPDLSGIYGSRTMADLPRMTVLQQNGFLLKEVSELQAALDEASNSYHALDRDMDGTILTLRNTEAERDDLRGQVNTLKSIRDELKKSITRRTDDYYAVYSTLEQCKKDYELVQIERDKLQRNVAQLQRRNDNQYDQIKEQQEQLRANDATINELQTLVELEKNQPDPAESIAALEARITELTDANRELQHTINCNNTCRIVLEGDPDEHDDDADDLREHIDMLGEQIKDMKGIIESLEARLRNTQNREIDREVERMMAHAFPNARNSFTDGRNIWFVPVNNLTPEPKGSVFALSTELHELKHANVELQNRLTTSRNLTDMANDEVRRLRRQLEESVGETKAAHATITRHSDTISTLFREFQKAAPEAFFKFTKDVLTVK